MKKNFAVLLSLSLASVACASRLSVDDRPCPCAAGWTCCAEDDVCVSPGNTCPRVTIDAGVPDAPAEADARLDDLGTIALASEQSVRCMTTDDDHVYWMDAKGRISGAPKRGGEIESEGTRDVFTPRCSLAIEHGLWIWGTSYSDGLVWRKTLTSNGEWRIGERGSGYGGAELTTPSSVAFDDDWVYVTEYEVGRVRKSARRTKSGYPSPEVVVLAKGRQHPDGVAIDDDYVYWIDRGEDPSNFGAIMKVAKDGLTEPVKLASATDPGGLVLHGDWVYWTEVGHVMKIPKVGFVATLVSDEAQRLRGIATDGTSLFWSTLSGLRQAPIEGGNPINIPVVSEAGPLVAFTADSGWLAWSDGENVWSRAR